MIKKIVSFFVIAIAVYACSSAGSDTPVPTDNFDRKAMLIHIADNIIIPSFTDFNSKLNVLKGKAELFNTTPNAVTLEDVRTAWYQAYKSWQWVEMFNIGKAEELAFVNHFNIYPLTVADVEANVINGTYDLTHPNNHDAQGFPALDYLFYGIAVTDVAIVDKYTTDANATKYKKYITDVVGKMSEVMTAIVNDWNGGYRDTFVNASGNTATSSVNKLVNDYVQGFEKGIRTNKIGIPVGVFSGGTTFPNKVEAFYRNNISKELALEALTASQNFFNGKYVGNANAEKLGFKAYLEALDRSGLAVEINNQFDIARTQINTLNNSFTEQITADNIAMTKTYDELQKNVVFLKTDMMQAFNISIDSGYVDNDGD